MIPYQIIRSAYENVPYYNYIINNCKIDLNTQYCFDDMPITTKTRIQEYGILNFINNTYLGDDYRLIDEQNMIITTSSGTSGKPMDIIWSKRDYLSSTLCHWLYRNNNYQITPSAVFFTSQRFRNNSSFCIKKNSREFAINTDHFTIQGLFEIYNTINAQKPQWLLIQPSVLYILVRFIIEHKLKFPKSINYIEFFSEVLLPYYKSQIQKVFKCHTSNMYGCNETNGIAYECEEGFMHILENNVLVEIVNRQKNIGTNKIGNVCVTSLHNRVMPIIRYKLNDKAMIIENKCSCGRSSPIIKLINTRIPEFIMFDDLNNCNSGRLYFPVDRMAFIKKEEHDVKFCIKRITVSSYRVFFDNDSCKDYPKWLITKYFKDIISAYGLKDCKFDFEFSKRIDPELPCGLLKLNI